MRIAPKHTRLSYAARPASLPVGHRPHTSATPDATVRPVTQVAVSAPPVETSQPTPAPTPPPTEPVVDLPPAAAAPPFRSAPAEKSNNHDATPVVPAAGKHDDKGNGNGNGNGNGQRQWRQGQPRRQARTARAPGRDAGDSGSRSSAGPGGADSSGSGRSCGPAGADAGAARREHARASGVAAPGNVEKKDAREARKDKKGQRQDAQTAQPAAATVPAPALLPSRRSLRPSRRPPHPPLRPPRLQSRLHPQTTRTRRATAATAATDSPGSAATLGRASSGHADVAQLVEHFTRNEGVGSSSLPVGFSGRFFRRSAVHARRRAARNRSRRVARPVRARAELFA